MNIFRKIKANPSYSYELFLLGGICPLAIFASGLLVGQNTERCGQLLCMTDELAIAYGGIYVIGVGAYILLAMNIFWRKKSNEHMERLKDLDAINQEHRE